MRATRARRFRLQVAAAVTVAGAVLLSACASADSQARPAPLASLSRGEGTLRLLGTAGYVEDGSTDPRVDWVTAFQDHTGCRVSYDQVPSVDAIAAAFKRHRATVDGVIAPPTVAGQLIGAKLVAPLNTGIIDGYTGISPVLRTQAAVTSRGAVYGLAYLWSSYVLGYGPAQVRPAPRTWAAVFDPASAARYTGRILLPDTPLTIALAALYLKSARPSLGITDPYELTARQFAAATGLLGSLRHTITRYYSQTPDVIAALASGSAVLGPALPRNIDILARAGRKVAGVDPAQGTTGSVNFWLMNAAAPHPGCMYRWLAWSITPRVQQQAAEWTGTAPVNPAACGGAGSRQCGLDHVDEGAYLGKVAFARLPTTDCGNGRHDCAAWAQWTNAWASIAGAAPG